MPPRAEQAIEYAAVDWRGAAPVSRKYGDIYFQPEEGVAESEYVFLNNARLAQKIASAAPLLQIGEFGFGTGLNFLLSAQRFLTLARPEQRLIYSACELHPLRVEDLRRALAAVVDPGVLREALLAQYPQAHPGVQSLVFAGGRIVLHLYFGEASDWLAAMPLPGGWNQAAIDLWYLDGFAPARNPAMWQAALFVEMAKRSRRHATVSTFSAAAPVREALAAAGFVVEKVPGFGRKREMLVAHLPAGQIESSAAPRRATVIGAGLAGCAVARALAERDIDVQIIDSSLQIAAGASGAAAGIVMPQLSAWPSPDSRLSRTALLHLRRRLDIAPAMQDLVVQPGAALLCWNDALRERYSAALSRHAFAAGFAEWLEGAELEARVGFSLPTPAIVFPQALVLSPPELCRRQLQHSRIELRSGIAAASFAREGEDWLVRDAAGKSLAAAPILVLACAQGATALLTDLALPLQSVRGQLFVAPATAESQRLQLAIGYDGYVSAASDGTHTIGASFERWNTKAAVEPEQNVTLYEKLRNRAPAIASALAIEDPRPLPAKFGFRAATPDHRPIVGPLHQPGLYASLGHGSRGIGGAQIAAALIAAHITGELPPLEQELIASLRFDRFRKRQPASAKDTRGDG